MQPIAQICALMSNAPRLRTVGNTSGGRRNGTASTEADFALALVRSIAIDAEAVLVALGRASPSQGVWQALVNVDAAGLPCSLEARWARVALVSTDDVYAQCTRLAVASGPLPRAFVDVLASVWALENVVVGGASSTQRALVSVVTPLDPVATISHEDSSAIIDFAASAVVHSAKILTSGKKPDKRKTVGERWTG
jgi:hypothetical protein